MWGLVVPNDEETREGERDEAQEEDDKDNERPR
jgi:hypothetical protein